MSEETPKPVVEVTEAAHTPAVEHTPAPVEPKPDESLKGVVDELSSKVNELSGMVTALIASGGGKQDSTPVSKPWTHRGGR